MSPLLRPYQREAIDAVLTARRSGVRRLLVCLPTGAGKTVIFSELAKLARRQVLVLRQLGVFDERWPGTLLGFTATTARGDGKGLDAVFERIVYSRTLPELIADGYLSPLRGFRVSTAADLTRLSSSGLDFREDE